jgi:hypothetical protein
MQEQRNGEQLTKELVPSASVIKTLHGVISEPITTISQKPGLEGQLVNVRLADEGAGLLGLSNLQDNKEWSGIFNHILLSARHATHFSTELMKKGHFVSPQRVLDGMLASHNGRRQWDEAKWYPDAALDADKKQGMSNETLGVHLVKGRIPDNAFDLVVALGHNIDGFSVDPHIYTTYDYKVAIYADHRTSQVYEPLHKRMGEFLLGNFFDRSRATQAVRETVYEGMQAIIELRRAHSQGRYPHEMTLEMADAIAEELGASDTSTRISRIDLMQLVLKDADTEAFLLDNGIDINLNEAIAPMPAWENDLRKKYVQAAEYELLTRFDEFHLALPKTWWDQYALDLYAEWSDPFMME